MRSFPPCPCRSTSRPSATSRPGAVPPSAPGTMRCRMGKEFGFRNAQATVIAPDRHDRPGHGLRHHRRRARFRAGEVQEAGRRRLFQDHQPLRARSACQPGLQPAARSTTSSPMPSAMARWKTIKARINYDALARQGLWRGRDRPDRGGAGIGLRHPLRLQQMDAGRPVLPRCR